jgi:hypothetical protein
MRKTLALLCLLAFPTLTPAADLQPKARPLAIEHLDLNVNGVYFGLWSTGGLGSIQGSALQVNPGINPNTITATEAAIGGLVGYYWQLNAATGQFVALEGMLGWQNINGNSQGFSFSGPATGKIRVLTGAPAATIAAFFPQLFPFPVAGFPASIGAVTNIKPYIYGAVDFDDVSVNVGGLANRDWNIPPELGLGMLGQVSPTMVVDVFAGVKLPQRGLCVGPAGAAACAGMGTTAVAGFALKW